MSPRSPMEVLFAVQARQASSSALGSFAACLVLQPAAFSIRVPRISKFEAVEVCLRLFK